MSETKWCYARRWDFTGTEPPVPACGHQTCAGDVQRHREGYEHESLWACPSGRCCLAWLEAECDLTAGHEGDHDFGERSDPKGWSDVDLGDGYPWPKGFLVPEALAPMEMDR